MTLARLREVVSRPIDVPLGIVAIMLAAFNIAWISLVAIIPEANQAEAWRDIAKSSTDKLTKHYLLAADSFANGFLTACGDPCHISLNPGGFARDYRALAARVATLRTRIVIKGDCYSACATFADKARAHVCVVSGARFHFHRSNFGDPQDVSPDIRAWVDANGGFPGYESGRFTTMEFWTARNFWRECEWADVALPPEARSVTGSRP